MKASILALFVTVLSVSGSDIHQYHEDFRFLLTHSEKLAEIPKKVATFAPLLENEVEVFAAENISSASESLYTSTYLLLQQHAVLVDVYVETHTFKDAYIRPSIEVLVRACSKVRHKCEKYLKVVRNPELFQQILDLEEIAKDIESRLSKYVPKPAPPSTPAPVNPDKEKSG